MERGKNLSKRFRKSCRNWAASKGLLSANNSGKQNVKTFAKEDLKQDEEEDGIEVIDLDEDPEVKLKAASEMDIGQLVADLVLDARRNNTLPRSKSRQSGTGIFRMF